MPHNGKVPVGLIFYILLFSDGETDEEKRRVDLIENQVSVFFCCKVKANDLSSFWKLSPFPINISAIGSGGNRSMSPSIIELVTY